MLKKLLASAMLLCLLVSVLPTMGEAASYHATAIKVAKKQTGVKYRWGGTTPAGFDCSGLLVYSFKKAGKTLPRTSAQMWSKGKKVSKLSTGDLVFFATGSNKKKVTHVGVYIGNGKFTHASSSKGVTTTAMSNSYWKPKYLGAKRF